jgi:O-antigen ligase
MTQPDPVLPSGNRFDGRPAGAGEQPAGHTHAPSPVPDRALAVLLFLNGALFILANIYAENVAAVLGIAKWISLSTLVVLLAAAAVARRPLLDLSALLPAGILVAVSLSISGSADPGLSFRHAVSVGLLIAGSWLLVRQLREGGREELLFDVIAALGRLLIAVTAVMWLLEINLGRKNHLFSGWTDNPNTLAFLLCPPLVIMAAGVVERAKGWTLRHLPFLVTGFAILIATGSRSSMVWLMVSCTCLYLLRDRLVRSGGKPGGMLPAVLALAAAAGLWVWQGSGFFLKDDVGAVPGVADYSSGRWTLWQTALESAAVRPLLGLGLGQSASFIRDHYPLYAVNPVANFHNSYLSVLAEGGAALLVPCLTVMLLAVLSGFRAPGPLHLVAAGRTAAIALAMIAGAMCHALFETWLLSAGSTNALAFWTCLWLLVGRASPRRQRTAG